MDGGVKHSCSFDVDWITQTSAIPGFDGEKKPWRNRGSRSKCG